ncbi:TraR/DksA C4-type zinc finger protein [Anaerobacillus isosaccharinicus]|uniref:TraR/DksA C4-type zinc finger protein n=1 Tax=Anaerobacillus isosaccharinicus TaxID=1532552 RepID=A0A1S2M7A4_9BACI|nr:TraR/DksA C4-type zinc finger protein [Anaerobacillus isosaccharinicus]MBA5587418.1 TraR/DksA C4-type zinc finger protein [Anaerobacillus isosaccharinicus]QOY34393.1 TraR/DksA C4-type zinc finger protein [Anaerobacillus isosaccharinicus]
MAKFDKIKRELIAEKDRLEERIKELDRYDLNKSMSFSTGELSQYDNHPADTATATYERGKDIALFEHINQEYEDVIAALERIENGTYGICEASGQKIPMDRLQALPTARTTIEFSKENVIARERPVEEDVLGNFDKYNFDNNDRETEFDAEDSWQSVAKFNDNSMVFEDSSLNSSEELIGYVEEIEAFASTDIEGYKGAENIEIQRNVHYDHYMDQLDRLEAGDEVD